MSFFEWLGRVIMLVLAGMITLSIIGAIAAIPSGSNLPRQIGIEREARREVESAAPGESLPPEVAPAPGNIAAPVPSDRTGTVTLTPAAPEPVDPAEWLEVIAYALLALAGLAALGIVLLWRLLHQQRRIADALTSARIYP